MTTHRQISTPSSDAAIAVAWVDEGTWRGYVPTPPRQWLLDHHFVMAWVAGAQYRKAALQDERFNPGKTLCVIPEPGNAYDPTALGIWSADRSMQIGYVPKVIAQGMSAVEETRFGKVLWEQLGPTSRSGLGVLLSRREIILLIEQASAGAQRRLARKVRQYQQGPA